jgi:hypothetical protein
MKNLGLKTASLVLAVAMWWVVSAPRREPPAERIFAADISVVGLSREFIITGEVRDDINVRLRGRRSELDTLSSRNLEATVDLRWVQRPGEAMITVRPQHLNVPKEIEVVSIDPNKLRFRVEVLRQRAVTIRPFLVGEVPGGYIVGEASASPDRALVSGPSSQILAMTEVGTERIIMTGRTGTFVQSVAVVSDSPQVRIIAPLTTQITVPVLATIGPNQPTTTQPDTTTP